MPGTWKRFSKYRLLLPSQAMVWASPHLLIKEISQVRLEQLALNDFMGHGGP